MNVADPAVIAGENSSTGAGGWSLLTGESVRFTVRSIAPGKRFPEIHHF